MGKPNALPDVAYRCPVNVITIGAPRFGYVWKHDVQSAEFSKLGSEARCVYLALLVVVDSDSQTARLGRTALAKLAGIHRSNTRRAIAELEAARLISVEISCADVQAADGSMKRVWGRTTYTLLCPPSLLRRSDTPAQTTLPFRRLSLRDFTVIQGGRRASKA